MRRKAKKITERHEMLARVDSRAAESSNFSGDMNYAVLALNCAIQDQRRMPPEPIGG